MANTEPHAGDPGSQAANPHADGRFAVLERKEQFRGPIFSVRTDTVAMPGGGHAIRDVVDHLRAVAIVAVDAQHRVVLIEQYRHPMRRRLWEIPAGLMDVDGEAPLAAAQRELAEETDLAAESWSVLVDIASSPGFCTEAVRIYLATELREVASAERTTRVDEEADLRQVWVPLADAVSSVMDGRIVNATAVAGILAAARHLGTRSDHRGDDHASRGLRAADDPWRQSAALVADGDVVPNAPSLSPGR